MAQHYGTDPSPPNWHLAPWPTGAGRQGSMPNEGLDSHCTLLAVPPTFLEPEMENSPCLSKGQGHPSNGTSVGGPPDCIRRRLCSRAFTVATTPHLAPMPVKSPILQSPTPRRDTQVTCVSHHGCRGCYSLHNHILCVLYMLYTTILFFIQCGS